MVGLTGRKHAIERDILPQTIQDQGICIVTITLLKKVLTLIVEF